MFEMFKSEFLRYRNWSILLMVINLVTLGFMARVGTIFLPDEVINEISFLVFLLGGLVFGFLQMNYHKKPNNWAYLIHRPLSSIQIYFGLFFAAVASMALVILVPWFVVVGSIDLFGTKIVDFRHYLYCLFIGGLALFFYLVGTITVLQPNRGAILLIAVSILLIGNGPANLSTHFISIFVMNCLVLYLNCKSFKPDLSQHLTSRLPIILMAIPIQLPIVYALILVSALFYHMPLMMAGMHPDQVPVEGSYNQIWEIDEKKQPEFMLRDVDTPVAKYVSEQAKLSDTETIYASIFPFPIKDQQFALDTQYGLFHTETNSVWAFSHDEMLIVGKGRLYGEPKGWLGMNGFIENEADIREEDRFVEVPVLIGDQFILTKTILYQVDFEDRILSIKHQTSEGERYTTLPQTKEHYVALLSNQNLYLFNREDFYDDYADLEEEYKISHPKDQKQVSWIRTHRLIDGYLLTYQGYDYEGWDMAGAEILYARLGEEVEKVGAIAFEANRFPVIIMNLEYIFSPVLFVLRNQLNDFIALKDFEKVTFQQIIEREYPAIVYWAIFLTHLFSGLIALMVSKKLGLKLRKFWAGMCFIIGLPALVTFFLMNKWLDVLFPNLKIPFLNRAG